MRLNAKWIGAGLVAVVGAAAAAFYIREQASEKPNHRSIMREGDFELRAYPPLLVAETVQSGERQQALDKGFQVLADYIFAKSRGGPKIAMTAPVLSDHEKIAMTAPVLSDPADDDGWRTRFVMPGKWTEATLPKPPAGVTIAELPGRRMAAVRFAGKGDDTTLAEQERKLRAWMEGKGLKAGGAAEYAFYNSPFIPGPLRRNEVLIPVE